MHIQVDLCSTCAGDVVSAAASLSCSSDSPRVSHSPPIKDGSAHPCLRDLWRGMTSYLTCVLQSAFQMVSDGLCFSQHSRRTWLSACARARACERTRVGTQVQSSSSVLILRVLTVSIESSWQLKEERKIGKWGGVSMLRPLPPHSSLAEDVWIYSGNATFERSKWEGSSFLLDVWIPSSGVSLSDAVQHWEKKETRG